jgi:hypothetical protein
VQRSQPRLAVMRWPTAFEIDLLRNALGPCDAGLRSAARIVVKVDLKMHRADQAVWSAVGAAPQVHVTRHCAIIAPAIAAHARQLLARSADAVRTVAAVPEVWLAPRR